MISGMMKRNVLWHFLLFYLIFFPLICSADTQLEQLLQPFTKISSVHFSYIETRSSLFFKKEQKSTGEMRFVKPDIIIKQILTPFKQKFIINKNQLSHYNSENKLRRLNINDYPQLKNYIALLKAVLNGDAAFLRMHYDFSIENRAETWLLTLSPIIVSDELPQRSIKSIQINAADDQINYIKMFGFGNEYSELLIERIIKKQNNATPDQ